MSDTSPTTSDGPFLVVGVGASAGGLEAFTRLLRALPPSPGFALLFVQHLDPTHDSLLVDILGRETEMTVPQGIDGLAIEPNHVYVIPPDTRMGVDAGRIRLEQRGDRAAPHLAVDHLFRTLASAYGTRAVAVVLSGTGTDGTLGVADVREAGGVAFAQDVASAGQSGMPASAAASAATVDAVLTPEAISAALLRLTLDPTTYQDALTDGADVGPWESLAPLFVALRLRSGIDFGAYKPSTIRRCVYRRMMAKRVDEMEDFIQMIRNEPGEADILIRDLLIGVTRFFRDPVVFDRLVKTALPALIKSRVGDSVLRIWVPGCSTGEEAYSLAMSVIEAMGDEVAETPVKELATDVNEESLTRARSAVFAENIIADISPERLRRFFRKVDGGYRVAPFVRDLCVFARHDLATDPPFARMDLISCRNVLIYFNAGLQRRVIPRFHYALRPGGILLLGQSETVGPFTDLFATADPEIRLFTRTLSVGHPHAGPTLETVFGTRPVAMMIPAAMPPVGGLAEIQREADRLHARYAPAGVVVDDNMTILQFRGETDPYLRHPHGTAGLDLLRMAREGLLADLRDGIAEARSKNCTVSRHAVPVRDNEISRTVTLQILPLTGGGDLRCFLVLFEDATVLPATADLQFAPTQVEEATLLSRLRSELEIVREHQQAVTEEFEASNEELKSTNEEILASNEELQSTNEELLTAKEELQSTNEELRIFNEEQGFRNRELERLNTDLRGLLAGANVPIVVIARDLRIRRLTAQAETAFGLAGGDVGRPLRETSLGIVLPELAGAVARVIDSLQTAEFEAVAQDGQYYSFRVRPYELEDFRIDGVVVTAMNMSAIKAAEAARHDLELKMFHAQKLESLGVMAGGVAHDLNNLLTPVLGYSELARASLPEDSPASKYLGEIDRTTRLAADLVRQILAYSGKSVREVRNIDLSDFVRSLAGLLTRAAMPKAELRLDLRTTPLSIEADTAQLSQVVLNLVTNAAESMNSGHVGTVTLRTTVVMADRTALSSPYLDTSGLPEGSYAVLEVTDTGSGMRAEILAKLFDPFYTTKFTGRGLGLAAVLGIIRGHHGTILVSSEPGLGSIFRVLLPITEKPAVTASLPSVTSNDSRGGGLVLIVDDDKAVREFLGVFLKSLGFEALLACDGAAAVESFRNRVAEVKVVLIDLTMPGKSGIQVASELRHLRPEVPVLMISGYTDVDVTEQLDGLRIDGFIHKPFRPGAIVQALKSLGVLDD